MTFTMRDLFTFLSLHGNTSSGPDDIPYIMFRYVPDESVLFLLDIPATWKSAMVTPVLKADKDLSILLHYLLLLSLDA